MIGCHQRQRLRADQPDAVELATAEQRAAEGEVIGRRRTQPAASGNERRWREKRTRGRIVLQLHAALAIGRVTSRQTMRLVGRHKEIGIVHAKRIEDAFPQELVEWRAADLADEIADHVGGNGIIPGLARRKLQRQDRKSTRLNSSHGYISYAVFCLKKKK